MSQQLHDMEGWEGDRGQEQSRPAPLQRILAAIAKFATRIRIPRFLAALVTSSADIEMSAGMDSTTTSSSMRVQSQKQNLYHSVPLLRGQFRLLHVLPNEDEDAAIHCRLFRTALDSRGTRPYEALSYVWGSGNKPRSIFVNGCDLAVGENLYAALLHLRDPSIERTIWIDAICINQEDPEEKGHQVQSMAKIYAKATRVIVWLGKEAAGSSQALEEIRTAASDDQSLEEISTPASDDQALEEISISDSDDQFLEEISTPASDDQSLKEVRTAAELSGCRSDNRAGIVALLQRPWFQRIWVLQEVAAARHILIKCGSAEIDGFAFCSGLNALNLFDELRADLRARILSVTYLIRDAIFRPKHATTCQTDNFSLDIRPLAELIEMYHTREATDRRDKVYALLGMSSDNPIAAGLSADYTISWKQVFNKLIHISLSELVSVDLSDDKEIAVIEGKGCVLGNVSSVGRNRTWKDRQDVTIIWKRGFVQYEFCCILPTTPKSIQKGDVVCLLQGASKPMILRSHSDHWVVVMVVVCPAGDLQGQAMCGHGNIKWSELFQSVTIFPHDFLLIWDWELDPDRQQDQTGHDYLATFPIPENSKTGLGGCLGAAYRIRNVRLALQEGQQLQAAVKHLREEMAVLERALRGINTLEKDFIGPDDSEKEDAKKLERIVNQLIEENGPWAILCLAAENGHETFVKLLLDTDKVNLHTNELEAALWFAQQKDYKTIVEMLLETGEVDANLDRWDGETALCRAAITGSDVVVQLLRDYTDQLRLDEEVQTAQWFAREKGHQAIVRALYDGSRDYMRRNCQHKGNGGFDLFSATRHRKEGIFQLLLDSGKVDICDRDHRNGWTAMHYAASNGNEAIVKLLLNIGKVDANLGTTAPRSAALFGHKVNFFQLPLGSTALHVAALLRYKAVVKVLLDTGKVDPAVQNVFGQTALHVADSEAVLKVLLDSGKVDANERDNSGETALHTAAGYGRKEAVKLLIDSGKVNVNIQDKEGRTALHKAAYQRYEKVVKVLLDSGKVDVDTRDHDGKTALDLAKGRGWGRESVVELLSPAYTEAGLKDKSTSS